MKQNKYLVFGLWFENNTVLYEKTLYKNFQQRLQGIIEEYVPDNGRFLIFDTILCSDLADATVTLNDFNKMPIKMKLKNAAISEEDKNKIEEIFLTIKNGNMTNIYEHKEELKGKPDKKEKNTELETNSGSNTERESLSFLISKGKKVFEKESFYLFEELVDGKTQFALYSIIDGNIDITTKEIKPLLYVGTLQEGIELIVGMNNQKKTLLPSF